MSNANTDFVRFRTRFSGTFAPLGLTNVRAVLGLRGLSAAVAGLATFGCGTPATLHITAPSSAVAGSPITVTVTATVGTNPDRVINSPIRFTSSDSAAVLPGVYYFTANDAGSHTFTNGVTLMTPGTQSITATVIGASALTATAKVTVSATTTATQSKVKRDLHRDRGVMFQYEGCRGTPTEMWGSAELWR